jgi:hypothetical protein
LSPKSGLIFFLNPAHADAGAGRPFFTLTGAASSSVFQGPALFVQCFIFPRCKSEHQGLPPSSCKGRRGQFSELAVFCFRSWRLACSARCFFSVSRLCVRAVLSLFLQQQQPQPIVPLQHPSGHLVQIHHLPQTVPDKELKMMYYVFCFGLETLRNTPRR